MKTRKTRLIGVAALGALIAAVGAITSGVAQEANPGVKGNFSLIMMVHTTSSSFGDLPGVNPWDGEERRGERFVYRSIACTGNAPVNNIASDLPSYGTRVKNSRVPSSMRAHPYAFKFGKSDKWPMKGTIKFTVCKLSPGPTPQDDPIPDGQKPKIRVKFKARPDKVTREMAEWHGNFRLVGGTGRYDDLTGGGKIAGYFFCFNPDGCVELGNYRDGQMVLHGRYEDPTPDLATPAQ